jgi:hypothetical protein
MPEPISPAQRDALLATLKKRFDQTIPYHPGLSWQTVREKLEREPHKLAALHAMEASGGEPNAVVDPARPSAVVMMDCAAESPAGRRSLCYDKEALLSRKSNPPADSAVHMAAVMGIELLSEEQYKLLQSLGDFDLKTSSWVQTPADVRGLGGALFCDKRFGRVFTYHNGADAYYGSRGFRGFLML